MKKTSARNFAVGVCFCAMLFASVAASSDLEYPLRSKYPELKPIETEELAAIYEEAIIVDARNTVEYDVVHIIGSTNILVGKMKGKDLLSLRNKEDNRQLVFYCNGTTCSKSYKAAEKALKWGLNNVRVYDDGIFQWAMAQPKRTKLLGKKLDTESAKTALISKEKLNSVTLSTADFLSKCKTDQYSTFDIRDAKEKREIPIRLPNTRALSMDMLVKLIEKNSKSVPRKDILLFDNVGKQVKWVQYHLEKGGITNYYFLKGGVRQLLADGYDATGNK